MISIYTGGFSRSFLNIFSRMGKEMSTCLRKYGVIQRLHSVMKIFFQTSQEMGHFSNSIGDIYFPISILWTSLVKVYVKSKRI